MTYSYEIIEALYESYKETDIDELYELIKILDELHKTTGDSAFGKEVDNLCKEHRICRRCLSGKIQDVQVGSQWFDRYEMPEYIAVCEECGEEY